MDGGQKKPARYARTGLFYDSASDFLGGNLFHQLCQQGVLGHAAQIPVPAGADGYGLALHLVVSDGEHVGHLLQHCLPDLVAHLLCPVVHGDAHARSLQLSCELQGVVHVPVCNGDQLDLFRCQPQGECSGVLLDQQGKGTLIAAQRCPVNDVGAALGAVHVGVFHAEQLRQHLVDLDGDEGVLLAVYVLDLDIQLGP